jgi:hypothetical protein
VSQRVLELCIPRLHDNHIVPALLRRKHTLIGVGHDTFNILLMLVSIGAARRRELNQRDPVCFGKLRTAATMLHRLLVPECMLGRKWSRSSGTFHFFNLPG